MMHHWSENAIMMESQLEKLETPLVTVGENAGSHILGFSLTYIPNPLNPPTHYKDAPLYL
jgi:hypothetical protein